MSKLAHLVFPKLMELNDYSGDFDNYFNAVYKIFELDFIKRQPLFEGKRISAKRYPEVDGIHRTFYHITHEGEDEHNRTPDLRRMERIRFPKFSIINNTHPEFLVWKNKRGKDTRVLIFHEIEKYLVVLTERKDFNLFWTAYHVNRSHQIRKFKKEYERYIKAKTA